MIVITFFIWYNYNYYATIRANEQAILQQELKDIPGVKLPIDLINL